MRGPIANATEPANVSSNGELENQEIASYTAELEQLLALSSHYALGHILVAQGDISVAQLENALQWQTFSGRPLGVELVTAGATSKKQIDAGLRLQRRFIVYALAVSAGLAPVGRSALAAPKTAAMGVSVTVVARAKLQSNFQQTFLSITSQEVAQGYVEVVSASRFSVHTNSRSGYLMEFSPIGNIFASVQVGGFDSAVLLGPDGGAIVHRVPPGADRSHELSFRFVLNTEVQPGTYSWPLHMAVRAL